MKKILILDTETTGIDPKVERVIEVGAILYSVEHGTSLASFSSLLKNDGNAAESVNRIPAIALGSDAIHDPWKMIAWMAQVSDAIVAHRAEFDQAFVPEWIRTAKPWICSKFDIEWPRGRVGESLVQLALEHDLGVAYAHRALTDCDLLARLFMRVREMGHDVAEMLRRAMRPKATFIALVSYDDRELAKKAGFQWDGGDRVWRRTMFKEDVPSLPFKTREVSL